MKKYICISIIIILFILIYFMVIPKLIPQTHDYSVSNETGKSLNTSIYVRKKENNNELILIFNDFETKNVIIINPELKLIGLSEGGRKEFIKINASLLFQKSKKADKYMIVNNPINDLIKQNSFSNKEIEFDTFLEYKKLGEKIIIKW